MLKKTPCFWNNITEDDEWCNFFLNKVLEDRKENCTGTVAGSEESAPFSGREVTGTKNSDLSHLPSYGGL